MRLVLTGGGTGGHIYPALEVGREFSEVCYLGSLRGQEGRLCEAQNVPFQGFASEPLWSLRTPAGWRALGRMMLATRVAKASLRRQRPDVVFSTGGYSAGPVLAAARSLGVPYVVHEGNSMPGRVTRMFAPRAVGVCCTFRRALMTLPGAIRTGHPVRRELREAAKLREERALGLVLGGSQGSRFLNEWIPKAARKVEGLRWLHATGPSQYDEFKGSAVEGYEMVPYLEADRMADAYAQAMLVVARSGSSLAEFAAFRIPSVLVPLPSSADDHQRQNADEFEQMGAAVTIAQDHGDRLDQAIRSLLENPARRDAAKRALAEWDVPDATARIASIIRDAASKHA